ncbi:hypothetical protein [Natrinema sp. SYSU A 869]|nr:hypothetical protein [Natrinema sp. SYSU A 869]
MSDPTPTAVEQTTRRREAGRTVAAKSGVRPLENAGGSVAEAGR